MPKQKIILIAGIVLALVAVAMTKVYIDQQRQAAQEDAKQRLAQIQANQNAVLVARVDIPAGTVIDSDMLEAAVMPNKYIQPQAVTSLDRISGMTTVADIAKGEQITLSKLSQGKQATGGGLAEMTPVGKRAITVSVDNIASLAGMVKPGDYVDVIAKVAVPVQTADGKEASQLATVSLFQNVLILAVGQETGVMVAPSGRYKKEEKKEISPLITLALSPQEANLAAFVQEQGKIQLMLRSPADSQIQQITPANWETFFQYVMPQSPKEAPKEVKREDELPVAPSAFVEIYRGLSKEKIPLSK